MNVRFIAAVMCLFLVACSSTDITRDFPTATPSGGALPVGEGRALLVAKTTAFSVPLRYLESGQLFEVPTIRSLSAADGRALTKRFLKHGTTRTSETTIALKLDTENELGGTVEMIYPVEYDAPVVKTASGEAVTLTVANFESASRDAVSATPATPTSFDSREIGPQGMITPSIRADGSLRIKGVFENEIFQGFVNYGKPIVRQGVVLTENRILMPVFDRSRFLSAAVLSPGQYLLIGPFPDSAPFDRAAVMPGESLGEPESGTYLLTEIALVE